MKSLSKLVTGTLIRLFRLKISADNDRYIEFVSKSFFPNDNPESNSQEKHDQAINLYNAIAKKYSLSEDHLEILDRIAEYFFRPVQDFEREFAVRSHEMQSKQINPELLNVFDAMASYWEENVTPEISNYSSTQALPFCNLPQKEIKIEVMGSQVA